MTPRKTDPLSRKKQIPLTLSGHHNVLLERLAAASTRGNKTMSVEDLLPAHIATFFPELEAALIADPETRESWEYCRRQASHNPHYYSPALKAEKKAEAAAKKPLIDSLKRGKK